MIRVVLDTNIVLVSLSKNSPYHWVFKSLINKEFMLCVTTDIVSEYEEVITEHMGVKVARNFIETIENLPNTELITRYFRWNLIKADYDDNKFCDCALAANANFIVTHDKHFNVLKKIAFPKINIIKIDEFKKRLNP